MEFVTDFAAILLAGGNLAGSMVQGCSFIAALSNGDDRTPATIGTTIILFFPLLFLFVYSIFEMMAQLVPKIKTRRQCIDIFFTTLMVIFFLWCVGTATWLGLHSVLRFQQVHYFATVSALINICWFIFLAGYKFSGLRFPGGSGEVDHSAGEKVRIVRNKADHLFNVRKTNYGPNLRRSFVANSKTSPFIYAAQETVDAHSNGVPRQGIAHKRPLAGFLRCGCCLDTVVTLRPTRDFSRDLEANFSSRSARSREAFLQETPVSPFAGFESDLSQLYKTHQLCIICQQVCHFVQKTLQERKLGPVCFNTESTPQRQFLSVQHQDDATALRDSSSDCHLCSLVWACLNKEQQDTLLADALDPKSDTSIRIVMIDDVLVPHYGGFNRPRRWQPAVKGYRTWKTEVGSEFASPLHLLRPKAKYRSGPLMLPCSHSTGSPVVIDLIKHALKDRVQEFRPPPTRLLDVREITNGKVRLRVMQKRENRESRERPRYTALSHCWGDPQTNPQLTPLLQSSQFKPKEYGIGIDLADFENGIDASLLTKTFHEAALLTHALGIDYIWIDSVCIIQNSADDWRDEAARMADVYRGAVCTIAATSAWDGSEGLFRTQDPVPVSPCLVGMLRDEEYTGPVYAVPMSRPKESIRVDQIALARLNTRGWCLQERYLSSVVIHFSDDQIYLDLGNPLSAEFDAPEPQPSPYARLLRGYLRRSSSSRRETPMTDRMLRGQLETDDIWKRDDTDFIPDRTTFVQQRLGKMAPVNWHSIWWATINEYTSRDLTQPDDKLPAVTGLAIFVHEQWSEVEQDSEPAENDETERSSLSTASEDENNVYLAGLWNDELASGLLWYVDMHADRPRPRSYRAPTWSWASTDGVVFNDSLSLDIDEADIQLLRLNGTTGEQKGSVQEYPWLLDSLAEGTSLSIRGLVVETSWRATPMDETKQYYAARNVANHELRGIMDVNTLHEQFSPVSSVADAGPLCHELLHPDTHDRIGWFLPDTNEALPEQVLCLKIGVTFADSRHTTRNGWTEHLLDDEDPRPPKVIRGLVLVRHESRDSGPSSSGATSQSAQETYRRVGYFELDCAVRTRIDSVRRWYPTGVGTNRPGVGLDTTDFLLATIDTDPSALFSESMRREVDIV